MELTKQQINTIVRLAMDDKLHYYMTDEVCPDYQQFVEETFGEYHFELHEEWQSCYDYEGYLLLFFALSSFRLALRVISLT